MADINSKLEIGVTTGPIRGSSKIHVGPLKVAMREIALEPSSGEPPRGARHLNLPGSPPLCHAVRFSRQLVDAATGKGVSPY